MNLPLILKIEPDQDPINPREDFDNFGVMVCNHRRYTLGDNEPRINFDDFNSLDEIRDHLRKEHDAHVILPLYLYDHSGITISTDPFSCHWDSGQVGFIYATRQKIMEEAPGKPKYLTKKVRAWAEKLLKSEVETYDQLLTGDVWGYVIEDADGEKIESCWGYFGEEYCRTEGQALLEAISNRFYILAVKAV